MTSRYAILAFSAALALAGCQKGTVEVKTPSTTVEVGKDGKVVDVKSPLANVEVAKDPVDGGVKVDVTTPAEAAEAPPAEAAEASE